MGTSVRIRLDNETRRFYAGDAITGSVECAFDRETAVRRVAVDVESFSHCSWRERGAWAWRGLKRRATTLSANQQHARRSVILAAEERVRRGPRRYRFRCVLPPAAPASFDGDLGYVACAVRATVEVAGAIGAGCTELVHVTPVVDLNALAVARRPLHLEAEVSGATCARSHQLGVRVTAPKSGFAPGETLVVDVHLDNSSSAALPRLELQLVKQERYAAREPWPRARTRRTALVTRALEGAKAWSVRQYSATLQIPLTEPTTLFPTHILRLDYFVRVVCRPRALCLPTLECEQPLVVGTVPLRPDPSDPTA